MDDMDNLKDEVIPADILESMKRAGATEVQIELVRRCAQLDGDECAEIIGSLNRLMLEPTMNYWDALHKAFEVKEFGVFIPKTTLLN